MARWWNFLDNFEARMDSFTPKIEVARELEKKYTLEEFRTLMDRLGTTRGLRLKSDEDGVHIFTVNGWKFGDRDDTKEIYPNDAIAEIFLDSKSRIAFNRAEDGTVNASSFEHFPGSKDQAEDYRLVLALRMKQLMTVIDTDL